jgi:hypothetical protein
MPINSRRQPPPVCAFDPADLPEGIAPQYASKLSEWGLRRETVERAEFYTEWHPGQLSELLNGIKATPPALILPGWDRAGRRNGFDVARMVPPHRFPDGREAKYLRPKGSVTRAYFPPLPVTWEAVNTPGRLLLIAESPVKALAAAQAGLPCLGLVGVSTWSVKRQVEGEERRLIPDLAELDWRGRLVLVVFDTDPERKPLVNREAAELARALTAGGAEVRLPRLPIGPRGADGRPAKQAIDEFIVREGEEAFQEWVAEVSADDAPNCTLGEWREGIRRERERTLGLPGVYLDTSPTGVGKSYADGAALKQATERGMAKVRGLAEAFVLARQSVRRSLTLVPSHAQCQEVVTMFNEMGLKAVAYPQLTEDACVRADEAWAVRDRGLSFPLVLCPECDYREGCPYREQYDAARKARHAVATQARGTVELGKMLGETCAGNTVLSVHEAPLDVLRPSFVTGRPLLAVDLVARQAEDVASRGGRRKDAGFYGRMARVAKRLDGALNGSNEPCEVDLPEADRHEPPNLHDDLNEACQALASPPGETMRLVLAACLGQLSGLYVSVDELPAKDGIKLNRTLVGVSKCELPPDVTVWLNDATATAAEIETVMGCTVRDLTPTGRLPFHHPVVQIIPTRDVTKATQPATALPILRGVLHDIPQRRVGLLTHWELHEKLPAMLEEQLQARIVRTGYFGGGFSRGSNVWIEDCDALIILGTPRVGSGAIRLHLLRLGKAKAAALSREATGWGLDWWGGRRKSGSRVTVRCWHYRNHDWHAAYCSIVRAELVQAIGRGRGVLEKGIPVYVVSTENLAPPDNDDGRNGHPLAEEGAYGPLTDVQARVLGCLPQDGERGKKTGVIAATLGFSRQRAHEVLVELEKAGRARRLGDGKRGWVSIPAPRPGGGLK